MKLGGGTGDTFDLDALGPGKALDRNQLRAWLDRKPPPKWPPCEHPEDAIGVAHVLERSSVYACTDCGAEWEVP